MSLSLRVRLSAGSRWKEVREMNRWKMLLLFAVCASYAPFLAACELCIKW